MDKSHTSRFTGCSEGAACFANSVARDPDCKMKPGRASGNL